MLIKYRFSDFTLFDDGLHLVFCGGIMWSSVFVVALFAQLDGCYGVPLMVVIVWPIQTTVTNSKMDCCGK